MTAPILGASAQLRALGVAIVTGSQGLEAVTKSYFQVANEQIVGCCALGGALLAVKPEMATLLQTDGFDSLDDQTAIRLELCSRFPVLANDIHNDAVLSVIEKKTGSLSKHFVDKNDLSLHHVIATAFDSSNATVEDLQSALNMVADQLEAA